MDFGTINNKLNSSLYTQVQEFISDVELVFNNAMVFNPPDSPVFRAAKTLLNFFDKNFSKAKLKEIKVKLENPNDPYSNISRILSKLKDHPDSSIFLFPVDPIVYPDYHDVIKNPIDLETMTEKLENNQYQSENDFKQDMELIFKNCFRYNLPGTVGYVMGIRFEKAFRKEWDTLVKRSKKF
jgi:hypothetical protein